MFVRIQYMNRWMMTSVALLFFSWQTGAVAQLILQAGQYGVGLEFFDVTPDATTAIRTAVWYPTAAGAEGNSAVYGWGDWRYESPFLGVTDSRNVPSGERFPLVVLSHGTDAWGGQFSYLGESLASHGYVVAAPYHNTNDLSPRADELIHVVDTMVARSESVQDKLHGLVDQESIAIGGYSLGVATASRALKEHTIDVDAVLLIDGAFNNSDFSFNVDVPIIHVGGGDVFYQQALFQTITPKFYAIDIGGASDLVRAHHWSFSLNGCQFRDEVLAAGLAAGATEQEVLDSVLPDSFWLGCNPQLIPPAEVQERMNVQAIGFLNSVLKNEDGFDDLLSPGKGTTAGDLWLTVSVDSNTRGKGMAVVLTDPDGRSIGFDASTGEAIDDFDGNVLGNAPRRPLRTLTFGLPHEALVPGEYVLTAVGATLDAPQTYTVKMGSAFNRGEDVVYSQDLVAMGTVVPNGEIEPFHFTLFAVPEPSSFLLLCVGFAALVLQNMMRTKLSCF